LRAGDDFEVAVLAVSVGMIPHVCRHIVSADARWDAMVRNIGTVATQSFQLWLDADERALGWEGPVGITLSGFAAPFDTWASMSHLLSRESWDGLHPPRAVAYFCGSLADEAAAAGPAAADAAVRAAAIGFLDRHIGDLWADAVDGDGRFRWELLHDPAGAPPGPERFANQYWRANIDPSDRYVQSLPGTDRHRIRPDDSGYDNLLLAGDWTDCGLNAGCIEAATRSGVLAAAAIIAGRVPAGAGR
ncbi:MAG: FAD-dependent oxidoreductase, partial [Actinomycetota bacterium]|nr:FAD-dependent oxidoreductase [Actinomycetota bacterium]